MTPPTPDLDAIEAAARRRLLTGRSVDLAPSEALWLVGRARRCTQLEQAQKAACAFCGRTIRGGPGVWHDDEGRENCPALPVGSFHEPDGED